MATVGGLIVGIENRDANTNVKFHQADTLKRIIERLEIESRVVIRHFISAPAKWIRSGRQEELNIYSRRQVYLIL